jgi:hypothetical protein
MRKEAALDFGFNRRKRQSGGRTNNSSQQPN